jgi:hypothetical protein
MTTSDPLSLPPLTVRQLTDYSDDPEFAILLPERTDDEEGND